MNGLAPSDGRAPVRLDIITLVPERWNTCRGCEAMVRAADLKVEPRDRGETGYPPEWESRFDALAGLVDRVSQRFGPRVSVRLWDPRTPLGLWYSLRHGAFRYPAFVVQGRKVPSSGQRAFDEVIPKIEKAL